MPRELVTVQIGQCGNQVGLRFWERALREHAAHNPKGIYDESMCSFFRNVDTRYDPPREIHVGDAIRFLRARAVLVDMEEGVVNATLGSALGELFDTRQLITDVSGTGNNWAHGHMVYGPRYHETLLETFRHTTEPCDSLQSFFLLHSMGGGTGSGLGTYILSMLEDEYPEVYRFTTAVFPSEEDDVVTSPYNTVLALKELAEHADCVLPVENQALLDLVARARRPGQRDKTTKDVIRTSVASSGSKTEGFDSMNNIVAHMLTNLTSSMRFEGTLNVDLNEITMNLVPFPRLHFLLPSLSPLFTTADVRLQTKSLDYMFSDAFSHEYQLIKAYPRHSTYLACGLLLRGCVEVSDIHRNISRIRPSLRMIHWNQEGFKIGLCSVPPVGQILTQEGPQRCSLLALSNNCCIRHTFSHIRERFARLYRRKAHVHHYTESMEKEVFEESRIATDALIAEYEELEAARSSGRVRRFLPQS